MAKKKVELEDLLAAIRGLEEITMDGGDMDQKSIENEACSEQESKKEIRKSSRIFPKGEGLKWISNTTRVRNGLKR